MNSVVLTGRLTRDPEVRYTQGENPTAIARFTVAVQRDRKAKEGEQSADFPSIIAFGRTAEFVEKYLKSGSVVEVKGRIETGSYTNKSGQKVYTTEVRAEAVNFGLTNSREGGATSSKPAAASSTPAEVDDPFMDMAGMDGYDEDMPFN